MIPERNRKGAFQMHELIDLRPYLPEEEYRIRPAQKSAAPMSFLLALESVVTAVIGVSVVIGIGAFLLML